jgi:hypothetical protein
MRQGMHQSASQAWRLSRPMFLTGLAVFFVVLMAALPAQLQAATQIAEVLLSDQADAGGVVATHKDTFTPATAEIKGTAFIDVATKGKKVSVELIYATQNRSVLSFSEDLPGSGKVTFTFALPKPDKGWPPGDYKLIIATSDGASKEVTFKVK